LFIQKTFLLALLVPIGLSSFSLFDEKSSSETSVSKPIFIEPIVIPKSVKEESNAEILEKLKVATRETFKNAEPSEEEVAVEVLSQLRALAKSREREKQRVLEEEKKREKKRELLRKKELAKKKRLQREKEIAKKKRLQRKKEVAKRKELQRKKERAIKRKLQQKRVLAKKRELEKKKVLVHAKKKIQVEVRTVRKGVVLGEHQDLHTLSKERERTFQNLEVVSESQPFTLEERANIRNPKKYQGVQKELKFDELPWVEPLGVVSVSTPFLKHN